VGFIPFVAGMGKLLKTDLKKFGSRFIAQNSVQGKVTFCCYADFTEATRSFNFMLAFSVGKESYKLSIKC
jgi:hypothetical protein